MRHYQSLTAAAVLFLFPSITPASSQADTPAHRLLAARPTYYTPTAAGLKSFSCNLDFDWKNFLESASGEKVEDTNPFLAYVKTVRLSVSDDLKGSGRLIWGANGLPPDTVKAQVEAMHSSFSQMLGGFFQTWNGFMNGGMVPPPDSTTTVAAAGDGISMHATVEGVDVTEVFDKNVLLTEAHVQMKDADVLLYPTYLDTPDGRLISVIRSVYKAPPSAPPVEVSMAVTYATVSTFRIPSTVKLSVKNAGDFIFPFKDCTVTK